MRVKLAIAVSFVFFCLTSVVKVLASCSSVPGHDDVNVSLNPDNQDADKKVRRKSAEAAKVMEYLQGIYGKKTLAGTMANVNWNINEAEWVYQHTGKYPAIAFFDYISLEYSPASWIDYSNTGVIEKWWKSNGLVGACWHWRVPCVEGSDERHYTPGDGSVDSETGKRATTAFSAARAIKKGTWENKVLKADLKKICGYLKLLRDKGIPVIWRPLHEAAGNIYNYAGGKAWFWWGNDGAEAFKKLWIYMYEYFNEEGLDNLIWVWTSQTKDVDFYPGDKYVDLIGRDLYPTEQESKDMEYYTKQFEILTSSNPGKMVALSECGGVAAISQQWKQGAKWLFFMPWYDYKRTREPSSENFDKPEHQYADKTWWTDAMSQPNVVTRDQIPSFN